jgi:metallophosphoesterase (TIGR00282 family)
MKALIIGDVMSRTGRRVITSALPELRKRLGVDICIANVENAAGIFGVTQKVCEEISSSGVDVMTSGNHIWDRREGIPLLDTRDDLLRPANYPPGVPGRGFVIHMVQDTPVAVVNLQGRTFMTPIDCPFRTADDVITRISSDVRIIIVDFHAEATSEKLALGFYLDGRVSVLAGTHTHVQTADERILGGGTAYITDVGMTGPFESIIGVKKEQVIDRFLYGRPFRFEVANESPCLEGLLVEIDEETGKAKQVTRVREEIEFEEGESG